MALLAGRMTALGIEKACGLGTTSRGVSTAAWTSSSSNPTGGVLSAEDFQGIARVVREKCRPEVRIYADEVYERRRDDPTGFRAFLDEERLWD